MNKRYIKQIKLDGFGAEAQKKLASAKVLVIGAGGLGCPAITYLAAAGVGTLGIMDHDLVDETNLHRQPIYTVGDIGKAKVDVASQRAQSLNPEAVVIALKEKITPQNALQIIEGYDIVLDCTDNYEARYLINDACVLLHKPWIYGAVEAWEGQAAVFNFTLGDGSKTPTYRCIFPEPDINALSCNDLGVIGTMPGLVGTMQANEAIKATTGAGKVLSGLLLINISTNIFQTVKLRRDEAAISKIISLKKDYSGLADINPEEISAEILLQNREGYFVIDIREDYELAERPFEMADIHIPMAKLLNEGFDFQMDKAYLLVCARGSRSMQTIKKIKELNPNLHIYSLMGGEKSL